MYKEVKGDLLSLAEEGHFDYVVHGCNCFHTMGAGIASQIAEKYPKASLKDKKSALKGDPFMLGTYTKVSVSGKKGNVFQIVNAYTQFKPGPYFREYYLQTFLDSFFIKERLGVPPGLSSSPPYKIGLPQIGCGIGGGDWIEVKTVLKNWADDNKIDLTVVLYEPKKENIRRDSGRMDSGVLGVQNPSSFA